VTTCVVIFLHFSHVSSMHRATVT